MKQYEKLYLRKKITMIRVLGIGETVLDILFKVDQPQKAVPSGSMLIVLLLTLCGWVPWRHRRADYPE
jgi:hypothetical protein